MIQYIQKYLKENNTLILPGLGALTITNAVSGEMMLMPFLKFDDGKLSKFISDERGIDELDAKKEIAQYINAIKDQLNTGQTFTLGEMGHFSLDASGEIEFTSQASSASPSPSISEEIKVQATEVKDLQVGKEEEPIASAPSSESYSEEAVMEESMSKATQSEEVEKEATNKTDTNESNPAAEDSQVVDSQVVDSKVVDSKVVDSRVEDSRVDDSRVEDSRVEESYKIANKPKEEMVSQAEEAKISNSDQSLKSAQKEEEPADKIVQSAQDPVKGDSHRYVSSTPPQKQKSSKFALVASTLLIIGFGLAITYNYKSDLFAPFFASNDPVSDSTDIKKNILPNEQDPEDSAHSIHDLKSTDDDYEAKLQADLEKSSQAQAEKDRQKAKEDAAQAKKDAKQAELDAIQAKKDAKQAKLDANQAELDAIQARKDAKQAQIDQKRALADAAKAKEDRKREEQANKEEKARKAPSKPQTARSGSYALIVGSFVEEQNAKKQTSKFSSLGYQPEIIQNAQGSYMVAVQTFPTLAEATSFRAKGEFEHSWIYKK